MQYTGWILAVLAIGVSSLEPDASDPQKIKYTKDLSRDFKPSKKEFEKFEIDQEHLRVLCGGFEKTVKQMIKNYKHMKGNIWTTVKESSIHPLSLKCLPHLCATLNFQRIEKIISLVDDKGERPVTADFWSLANPQINRQFELCKKLARDAVSRIDHLIAKSRRRQSVMPVFKWGQSNQEVFIEVKLSHRFDAPGCLESISSDEASQMVSLADGSSSDPQSPCSGFRDSVSRPVSRCSSLSSSNSSAASSRCLSSRTVSARSRSCWPRRKRGSGRTSSETPATVASSTSRSGPKFPTVTPK